MKRALLFFLLAVPGTIAAQSDSLLSFYPLHTGDTWRYQSWSSPGGSEFSVTVAGDTLMTNGNRYKVLAFEPENVSFWELPPFQRIDSATATVYAMYAGDTTEFVIDSIGAGPGDELSWGRYHCPTRYVGIDTGIGVVLGKKAIVRKYSTVLWPGFEYWLGDGIGFLTDIAWYDDEVRPWSRPLLVLTYARIAGVEYSTGVAPQPVGLSTRFRLFQHYPNPFNPTTIITYEVPEAAVISLKVFDLLGRQIATLVEERKLPGTHSVVFDASRLASGIYLCRLTAGRYAESRTMLLLR